MRARQDHPRLTLHLTARLLLPVSVQNLPDLAPWDEDGPCFTRDEAFRSAFAEASISVGADDVGALGQGLIYYDAMLRAGSPQVRVDVLPGLGHGLRGPTDAGRLKIRDVVLQECVVRSVTHREPPTTTASLRPSECLTPSIGSSQEADPSMV